MKLNIFSILTDLWKEFALLKKQSANDKMKKNPSNIPSCKVRNICKKTGDLNISVYKECSSQGKKKLGLITNFKLIKFQRIFKVQRLKFPLPGNNAQNKQMI